VDKFGFSVCWHAGMLACWHVGMLEWWHAGPGNPSSSGRGPR
jgi:hypothetical protein